MTTIITSLPVLDNDGRSTATARAILYANLRAGGVEFTISHGARGFWYDDDGKLFSGETVVVVMSGHWATIRRALGTFGLLARQHEVLCVTIDEGAVVGEGHGEDDAALLARAHGGSTMLADGRVFSLRYAGLKNGTDYRWQ